MSSEDDALPRAIESAPRLDPVGAGGRKAAPFSSHVTENDSFYVVLKRFEDLTGACQERGWVGKDLTTTIFAHVDTRVVNDGYVSMGTRAFWFGADAASHPGETSDWILAQGYGGGWSQRLTSPAFSRVAHPDAVLRFDAHINLRRNTGDTGIYGIPLSAATGNTFLGVQGLMQDGTWGFVRTRQFQAGGPTNWEEVPPLDGHWVGGGVYTGNAAVDRNGNVLAVSFNGHAVNRRPRTLQAASLTLGGGAGGSAPGSLLYPIDLEVDAQNEIYVVEFGNHRVQVFDSAGNHLRMWGSLGDGPGQFNAPRAIAIDAAGDVFVADNDEFGTGTSRIQKFDRNGVWLSQWTYPFVSDTQNGMAFGPDGNLYVTDGGRHAVDVFSPGGTLLATLGGPGTAPGTFLAPAGIAFDHAGDLYVADSGNHRVQRLGLDGTPKAQWGTFGTGYPNQLTRPNGLAISPDGDVYVIDETPRWHRFHIGGPLGGWGTVKQEVHLGADGNEVLPLAEPLQLRIVFQSGHTLRGPNAQGGNVLAGDSQLNLIDNVSLTDGAGDVIAPVDFEDGTTGAWTVSAQNGAYSPVAITPTAIRDDPPLTSVALRSGHDFNDPTCVWTMLSPSGYVETGTFASVESPWIGLPAGTAQFAIRFTNKLNLIEHGRFMALRFLAKDAGATRPQAIQAGGFIYFGGSGTSDLASPFFSDEHYSTIPTDFGVTVYDSVKLVLEVWDQYERFRDIPLGGLTITDPESRPQTRLPFFDDINIVALGVDQDYDGIADAYDTCPTISAAGQDADGDGCPDQGATLRHVESWEAAAGPIPFRLAQEGHPGITDGSDLQAMRDAFATWEGVSGASLALEEQPVTAQSNASAADGVNLVTFTDDFQFPANVLAITPTTSFTRRTSFDDRIVLPGQIVDGDVIFNPASPLSTTSGGGGGTFDLQSTAVHEIGHFLGLSHSPVADATMNPVLLTGIEAASLAEDDQASIAAAYPDPTLFTTFGRIEGRVTRGGSGLPVAGAMVVAWRVDGVLPEVAAASDYTDENGDYRLFRLAPGDYAVRIAPLDGTVPGVVPEAINLRVQEIAEIDFEAEWYGGPESASDDPAARALLAVAAGATAIANVVTNIDVTPPSVAGVSPPSGTQGVRIDSPLLVTFSEPIDANTLGTAFRLRPLAGGPSLGGSGQLLTPGLTFVFVPAAPLAFDTEYQIEITTDLRDRAGLAMAAPFTGTFRTELQPPVSIANVEPREAPAGAWVTLAGTGYDAAPGASNTVAFTNSASQVTVVPALLVTPTSLVAQVPADAVSGPLQVSVNGQPSNLFGFVLLTSSAVAPAPNGAPVALAFAPRDVAVAPDGGTVFAVGAGGLARINLNPARPLHRVSLVSASGDLERVALTPDGLRGFASAPDAGQILEFDADPASATFGQPLGTVALPGSPDGLAVSPSGRRIYATDQVSDRIFEVDVDPGSATYRSLLREIVVAGAVLSGGVAFDAAGARLFVTTLDRGVQAVDLATGAASAVHASAAHAAAVLTPAGTRVLAAGEDADRSRVLSADVGGTPAQGSAFVGGYVRDLLVHPAGGTALAVNSVLATLQVLDVAALAPVQVASVPTGSSPLAIAGSADGTTLAVANFGSRSISLYTMGSAAALVRLSPPTAMPGDLVTVETDGGALPGGVTVEIGGATLAPVHSAGGALAFRVPPLPQGEAAVALAFAGGRTLSLPLAVVDPIESHAAAATGIAIGPVPAACANGAAGAMDVMRTSPDGTLLAVLRAGASCLLLDLYRSGGAGGTFGARLLDGLPLGGAGAHDAAFTPDGRRLWVAMAAGGLIEVSVDPGDPGFGTILPFGLAEVGTARALATDPFGRYMVVAAEPGAGAYALQLWTPGRALSQSVATPGAMRSLAISPDGRLAVAGGDGAAYLVDLAAPAAPIVTPSHGAGAFVHALAIPAGGARALGVFPGDQLAIWNLDPTAGAVGAELYFGAPLPGGAAIGALVPAADGDGLLAGCEGLAELLRIDTSSLPPAIGSVPLGEPARALARSVDGRLLFAASWDDGTLAGALHVVNLDGEATRMAVTSGLDQSAEGGQTLPLPVGVQVTDDLGAARAGLLVAFELSGAAQGSLEGQPGPVVVHRVTDLRGEAAAAWTMPLTPATADLQIRAPGTAIPARAVVAESVLDDALAAPVVVEIGPAGGSTGIRAGTTVYARFSQRMSLATLKLELRADGVLVPGRPDSSDGEHVFLFTPSQPLPYGSTCTFEVLSGALDREGQALATGAATQFVVEAEPVLEVTTLSPPAAATGAEVTLLGNGFGHVAAQNVVRFGAVQATVLKSSATSILVVVPATVPAGSAPVTVGVGTLESAPLAFSILSPNPQPSQLLESVSARTGIQDLAISPDGNRVYVTSPTTNSVLAFQLKPSAFLASIPVGLLPQSIAFVPDGRRAYVANSAGNNVSVIDTEPGSPTYNRVLETGTSRPPVYPIKVGAEPTDVSVSPFGPTVVVLNSGDGTLSLIEADPYRGTQDAVTSSVNLGSGGQAVAVTPDGTRAYVATASGVVEVSLLSKAVTSSVNLGSGSQGIAITPDGTVLFVITEHDSLFVIDIAPGSSSYNRVTSSINLGSGGQDVAVTPDGALLYVTLRDEDAVAVFQIIRGSSGGGGAVSTVPGAAVTLNQVASIAVGASPAGVYADPLGEFVLVANEGAGTLTVLGTPPPPEESIVAAAVPALACISPANPCAAIPVDFTRIDATPVRAFSVRVRLSAELATCGPAFAEGTYLSGTGAETFFQVLDRQDGSYDVDGAILGAPCGATGDGTLFTLHLGSAAASAIGTITIESVTVRDCANQPVSGVPGPSASVPIRNVGPAAPTALAAQRLASGNDADGTMKITITFAGSVEAGGRFEVWRRGYGNHPLYDGGGTPGSVPAAPAGYPPAGWTLTPVTASGQSDEPPSRDFWYYVTYAIDPCQNATASAMTTGTLNYLLGDVTNGSVECTGDNAVGTADVSLLGSHYGQALAGTESWACLDVGPTEDGSVNGRPLTDGMLQFEDLVMFALNFGVPTAPAGAPLAARGTAGGDRLVLEAPAHVSAGETFDVRLRMSGGGVVQALSAALGWNEGVVEPVGVIAGSLLDAQGGVLLSPSPGRIDAALLGARQQGLTGDGTLAVWSFRALADGDPGLAIGSVDARDRMNRPIELGAPAPGPELPAVTAFDRVAPNPFTASTSIAFSLAVESPVRLSIYSVDGRRVRTLAHGTFVAGTHRLAWDGTDARGSRVGPGLYFVRLEMDGRTFTKTLALVP